MRFSIAVNMTRRRPDVPMERVAAEGLPRLVKSMDDPRGEPILMARAALLLATELLDRVSGRVTYSQQILKEFSWIDEARGRGADTRGSGCSEIWRARAREQTTLSIRGGHRMRSRAVAVIALTASLCLPIFAAAQDAKLEVQKTDSVKTLLERQMNKRVAVVLTAGPEVAGIVTVVGDKVVQLSKITGREFYDAVVAIDHIAAVIVRTDGK